MKIVGILILLILSGYVKVFAQLDSVDYRLVYNGVYKNIIAYNLATDKYALRGVDVSGNLSSYARPFFDPVFPDKDERMKLDIAPLNIPFPIPSIILYSVYFDRLEYIDEKGGRVRGFSGFGVNLYNQHYLVGVDTSNQNISYLSGAFYLNKIAHQFDFDKKRPDTYLNYLQIRLYTLSPKSIVFKSKVNHQYCYEFVSERDNKKYRVYVDIKNPDRFRYIRLS